jgi:uncharacterized protein (TIGR02145 family)
MKQTLLNIFPLTLILSTICHLTLNAQTIGSMIDPRDGQSYKTVKIGTQTWMAENLNYETANSWCYENDPANCEKYGRLYLWESAQKGCPSGWHLPSDAEWKELNDYLGGANAAGKKMKSTTDWHGHLSVNNSSGFSALPSGFRNYNGSFGYLSLDGNWWSSSGNNFLNSYWNLFYGDDPLRRHSNGEDYAYSVRCLKD